MIVVTLAQVRGLDQEGLPRVDVSSVLFNRPLHACRPRTRSLDPWTAQTRTRFVCRCSYACEHRAEVEAGVEKVGTTRLGPARVSLAALVPVRAQAQVDRVATLLRRQLEYGASRR